jgi:hypothetical protein
MIPINLFGKREITSIIEIIYLKGKEYLINRDFDVS